MWLKYFLLLSLSELFSGAELIGLWQELVYPYRFCFGWLVYIYQKNNINNMIGLYIFGVLLAIAIIMLGILAKKK